MQTAVIYFDSETEIKDATAIEEKKGKLASQFDEDKLMHSVLENDKEKIQEGKLIADALNVGLNSFMPDLLFEQLVKNYNLTKKMLGPTMLRALTDFNPDYIEKNIRIPEFQRELKKHIEKNIDKLQEDDLIDHDGMISDKGIELASLILYTEELDKLIPRGLLGERVHKRLFTYGDKEDVRLYKKGDRYRDIAIKKSIQLAVRRGKKNLGKDILKTFERKARGQIQLIYALDASGSMKGKKIETCKKAGIALAFKAIEEKDKVGLVVFGSDIKDVVEPTTDFKFILDKITRIKAAKETNIAKTIEKAVQLFPPVKSTKHLVLLTDAVPTVGEEPEQRTLDAAGLAKQNGVTISLIGIQLDEKGKKLAEKIVAIGEGKLYIVRNLEDIDAIVLEDYYSLF